VKPKNANTVGLMLIMTDMKNVDFVVFLRVSKMVTIRQYKNRLVAHGYKILAHFGYTLIPVTEYDGLLKASGANRKLTSIKNSLSAIFGSA